MRLRSRPAGGSYPYVACIALMLLAWAALPALAQSNPPPASADLSHGVYIVPNFHPASCGWLADFSIERNHCAYSYLAHLDRVRDDPGYAFALSECNNVLAIMAFEPQRIEELKQRLHEGRAELVNAFFLEPTINLSGGEALVKMGVEGLRWQQQVMGVRPRAVWAIDVTGVHEQMAQIVSGLGLDAMVYTRDNPTSSNVHWFQSPDGSRTIAISTGNYADWGQIFHAPAPLPDDVMKTLLADAKAKAQRTPEGLPVIVLGGGGDYSLPLAKPTEFLKQWKGFAPDVNLRFATLSQYLDAISPVITKRLFERSSPLPAEPLDLAGMPISRSGARMTWTSFWIQGWPVKTRYRHAEHALQSAECISTAASLTSNFAYPVQPLYHAWLEMCLNMDRNTLWGAAAGKVFTSLRSWDAQDRFNSVEKISETASRDALKALLGSGTCVGLFNPLNWRRTDPVLVESPEGVWSAVSNQADGGGALFAVDLPPMSAAGIELSSASPEPARQIPIPPAIETAAYTARIDPKTAALVSLKLKPSGRELLAGPVTLVAETGQDAHDTPPRPKRQRLADSSQCDCELTASDGPLATVVTARSKFHGGGELRRVLHFYKNYPRVDFDVDYQDIPNGAVVLAEIPLAQDIRELRRGIPYGFSHGAWSVPNPQLTGFADGIQPAIRWSHYQMDGCGLAILDRGLPGRELNGRTPVIFLLNAQDTYLGYPCAWLSGKGKQHASFALFAHEGDFKQSRTPQMAWEYNCPPIVVPGTGKSTPRSLLETSPNLIVEALRREGPEIELRLAECFGVAGTATVKLLLPHQQAFLTDLTGANRQPLAGGPEYTFPVRPQQIVTLRFTTDKPVDEIQPLLKWDELVPPHKLAALRKRMPDCKGHPPMGTGGPFPTLPPNAAQSLTLGATATASNVFQNNGSYAAEMAFDGDESTRWATDGGTTAAWLEVDLGRPARIGQAYLSEAYDRVRRFELQRFAEGEWRTFASGSKIGLNLNLEFEPVTAQRVRLNVLEATDGPTIWEFHLFSR